MVEDLFQIGSFTLHSSIKSDYLINCNALSDNSIKAIAAQLVKRLPRFSSVEGIPRGGLRLAEAMKMYISPTGLHLIADDVFTTGMSMEEFRSKSDRECVGAVIFARNSTPKWISYFLKVSPING